MFIKFDMEQKRVAFITVGIIAVIVISAVGWYLLSPLFLKGDKGSENIDLNSQEILYHGTLNAVDSVHKGEGDIYIVTQSGIMKVLFVDVQITNGPDLYVYLSDKTSFSSTTDSPGSFKNLGTLDYTHGNFSVSIPGGTPLDNFNSVLIYCKQFSVVFTWATLEAVA